jgi:cytochrome P450
VTLSWWVKYMAANPDIQRKLRNYLRKTMPEFDDRPPAYADVTAENLPYLEAVAWETLRLAKTAGAVTRQATVDTEILGKL